MRVFTAACLTLVMMVQTGCTTAAIKTTHQKQELDSKVAKRYLAARQFEARGKLEPAREIYSDLLLKHPRNADIQHRLAVVCTQLQRYGEAQSLYTRALKRDPRNASLLTDMGYFFYLRGDSAEAELILKQALHVRPDDPRATSNLALVVGRKGRMEESLKLLRRVHNEPDALSSLAYIHHLRGEEDLAKIRYREALSLDPNLNEASVALAELTKRHPDITVADFVPNSETATEPGTLPETSEIQQVSSVTESTKGSINTANFASESATDDERVEGDAKPKWLQPAVYLKQAADAADAADADESTAAPREVDWTEQDASSNSHDGLDWSAYEPDATKPSASSKLRANSHRAMVWDADEPESASFDEDADSEN